MPMFAVRHSSITAAAIPTIAAIPRIAALAALALAGCASTPKPDEAPPPPVVAGDFTPASAAAPVRMESGRYPNLFAPSSYAVWVTNGVAAAKMQREQASGADISPLLAADAQTINANFYVVEVNLESAFPDASIAYDVVGLRAIDVYLTLPDGTMVYPAQRVMATSAAELQEGALRRYGRTNLIVFPKVDVLSGAPTVPGGTAGLRLTLDGFNSIFSFEWASGAPAAPPPPQESGGMTWSTIYTKLRELSRISQ
jgi:hypothetical protein